MQQWVKFVPQCHQLFQVFGLKKKNLKIGLSSVRKMYVVGALLRNAPNAPKKKCKNSTYIAFKSSYSRVTEMVRFFSPNDKWNINTTVNYTCVFHNQSPFVL